MCGIVGFWDTEGQPASPQLLERMLQRVRYRGPDDHGTWVDGAIGLGHCRLSILDLSPRGHQPFVTVDGEGALAYNGEVYNFQQLRAELEAEGTRFHSACDTEVVLYALHRWGPQRAIPRFNGMFALAYFDRRARTLWLARDRLGIKPLYLARYPRGVAFASEIKALLAHPAVPCRPDMHAVAAQVLCRGLEGDWTPFEHIASVRPGTIVKLTERSTEQVGYFDVVREMQVDRLLDMSRRPPQDLLAEFETRFSQSVRAHLVSDVPLATMCSGGLDSSLMTAVVKSHKPGVVAYVADVKGTVSEGRKAHRVGRHLGVEVRQVDVDQDAYLRLWPVAIWHNDQPTFHEHDMPFLAVAQACRRDGINVLLTGEGSDELFGGYPWQQATYQIWRLRRLHASLIPNVALFRGLGRLTERFVPLLAPLDLETLGRCPFLRVAQLEDPDDLLRRACVADGGQRLLRHEALFRALRRVEPLEDRAFLARCLEDVASYLQTLLHRNDRMGMAASIEARVPFLENGLIDFAMHLPRRAKLCGRVTKRIVKQAAEKRLPRDIVHAPKLGFAVPDEPYRRAAVALLRGGMVPELLKWDARARVVLLERVRTSRFVALTLAGVELWARLFLRGESPDHLGEELVRLIPATR